MSEHPWWPNIDALLYMCIQHKTVLALRESYSYLFVLYSLGAVCWAWVYLCARAGHGMIPQAVTDKGPPDIGSDTWGKT